jgi:hypothetical protein
MIAIPRYSISTGKPADHLRSKQSKGHDLVKFAETGQNLRALEPFLTDSRAGRRYY